MEMWVCSPWQLHKSQGQRYTPQGLAKILERGSQANQSSPSVTLGFSERANLKCKSEVRWDGSASKGMLHTCECLSLIPGARSEGREKTPESYPLTFTCRVHERVCSHLLTCAYVHTHILAHTHTHIPLTCKIIRQRGQSKTCNADSWPLDIYTNTHGDTHTFTNLKAQCLLMVARLPGIIIWASAYFHESSPWWTGPLALLRLRIKRSME